MTGVLAGLAGSWWEWCAAVSLQVAVLSAAVLVLDRILCRRAPPRMLAVLWLLVVARVAVPPAIGSPVSFPGLHESAPFPGAPAPGAGGWELPAALLVWLSGSVLLGAACLLRWRALRREWLGGVPRPLPAGVGALAREAAARLGLGRVPEIRIAQGAPGPAVVGFLRVVVVLPAKLVETAAPEEVRHVLLHELAHVRRRDPLVQLLSVAAQVVLWFHPSIWLARRRLSALAELCCDEAAAAALGGSTAAYRRTLLRLARPLFAAEPFGSLAFFRRRSQLRARIESLERRDRRRGDGPRGGGRLLPRRITAGGLCALVLCFAPPARSRAALAGFSPPPFESLQGCLQLRYAVQAALARRSLDPESTHTPVNRTRRRAS